MTELETFYTDLDQKCNELSLQNAGRLQCKKGCSSCCVDDITVFEIEAENIKTKYSQFLKTEYPHQAGACAFLDNTGACRIYDARPYVCRTQGLPLRWIEENTEYRDICPLNELENEPVTEIEENKCFHSEPYEIRLALMQIKHDHGAMKRIALRSLFEKP